MFVINSPKQKHSDLVNFLFWMLPAGIVILVALLIHWNNSVGGFCK